MDISFHAGMVVFRTPYDDQYDLAQTFRGLGDSYDLTYNAGVDFRSAGLVRKRVRDIWHLDRVFALSTDEMPPSTLNGYETGGGHGCTAALQAVVPGHGLSLADVGTLFTDEEGEVFTLARIETPDRLMFLSGSLQTSCKGALRRGELALRPVSTCAEDIHRAARRLEHSVWAVKDGVKTRLYEGADGVDSAEIHERYEIMDPVFIAGEIAKNRPEGGYTAEPDLAVGTPYATVTNVYEIQADGTVLIDTKVEPRPDVTVGWIMGIMYQEKCDQGGGNLRLMPGVREVSGYEYLAHPFNTSTGPFPTEGKNFRITREFWADPANPPCRQLDAMLERDGQILSVFAAGLLPLFDGRPEYRAPRIGEAVTMAATRKTYPSVRGSYLAAEPAPIPEKPGESVEAVFYRKYFPMPDPARSEYTISYRGVEYRFEDEWK